jgi:hypothetical protein
MRYSVSWQRFEQRRERLAIGRPQNAKRPNAYRLGGDPFPAFPCDHGVPGVKKVEASWMLAQPASFCGVSRILSRRSLLEETARMTICLALIYKASRLPGCDYYPRALGKAE